MLNGTLGDICENGISASERDHCHLAEEDGDLAEDIAGPKRGKNGNDWDQPKREPYSRDRQRSCHRWAGVLRELISQNTRLIAVLASG